jgi:hypothetical protein
MSIKRAIKKLVRYGLIFGLGYYSRCSLESQSLNHNHYIDPKIPIATTKSLDEVVARNYYSLFKNYEISQIKKL